MEGGERSVLDWQVEEVVLFFVQHRLEDQLGMVRANAIDGAKLVSLDDTALSRLVSLHAASVVSVCMSVVVSEESGIFLLCLTPLSHSSVFVSFLLVLPFPPAPPPPQKTPNLIGLFLCFF